MAKKPNKMKIAMIVNRNTLVRGVAAGLLALKGLLGVSQSTSAADGRFVNLSTRALVETGEEVMIGGFIIKDGARQVLIQAIGPELVERGIANALVDPILTFTNTTDPGNPVELMVNDDWEDSQRELVTELWGGSPNLTAGSLSAAVVLTLEPGNYTAKVEGKDGAFGVASVEVYEIDSPGADGRFVNLSTRALVQTGEEVMIGGFIIEDGARQVLIQAVGPELAARGIANALADPVLTVTNTTDPANPVELMVNDDWADSQGQLVTELWGGSPNLTAGSLSSAAILTLEPGNYTAKVEGKDGTAGIAIVEVYGIDAPEMENPERTILIALYNAMDGANWTNSDNWLTDAPLDQWHGITVDENGRVVGLDLRDNQLSGPIPVELSNLTGLRVLKLGQNQLSGPIPEELGLLASLTELSLANNQLDGPIPAQLGNLISLLSLELNSNDLSGPVPSQLGDLSNLTELQLEENALSGPIPSEIGNLENLESLLLSFNELTGSIPSELGNLVKLEWLSLSFNDLTGSVPSEMGDLVKLAALDLTGNALTGPIPSELGNLANLTFLWLSDNEFAGPIPSELGDLSNLEWLYLDNNELTGPIPSELDNLDNLTELRLDGNELCIPADATLQGWLEALSFQSDTVVQCESDTKTDRDILEALYNATDGPNWTNKDNWLTDAPLDQWHGVSTDDQGQVIDLDLRRNRLSGSIPSELGSLANLTQLWLSVNDLTGPIPSELGNLENLEWLEIKINKLTGSVPSELGNLTNLTALDLSDNNLSGSIPSELGNLSKVVSVLLSFNNLTGPIPSELGNLENLEWLSLSFNDLTGSIPSELGNLANLTSLDLSFNEFTGSVPTELGNLEKLTELLLAGNELCVPADATLQAWLISLSFHSGTGVDCESDS